MNILKSITLNWRQVAIFKITAVAFGVAVGAYWADFFRGELTIILIIFALGYIYTAKIWLRNMRS